MGLMEQPRIEPGRLILTPHPITLDGQQNLAAELLPAETLGAFLSRTVPEEMGTCWEVRINGIVVPHEVLPRVRPKPGTIIEVRSIVQRQALMIVAMAALTYFTFGFGAATASMWGAGAAATAFGGGLAGALFATALYTAGSMLINKVLAPKQPRGQSEQNTVHSIGAGRNQIRQYQPLPIVFGRVRFAPDLISAPYPRYQGQDQYVGLVLTPGVNVGRVEALYNGDTLLSTYEGTRVWHSGFPGMTEEAIPLFSNADSIAGAELFNTQAWVERTTPADTVQIVVNLEYRLGDNDRKGAKNNRETVQVEYRSVGASPWLPLATREFVNNNYDTLRTAFSIAVGRGQYEVRARRLGRAIEHTQGKAQFTWTTLTAVQADDADYSGIPRIGVELKATGQLTQPDEIRCVVHSRPVPVWKGEVLGWVTEETSNPGAHMLAYARGIYDNNGQPLAGMFLRENQIDLPAFQAFMLHCAAEGYTYDHVVKDVRNHEEMCQALALAGLGQHTWASGRFSVVWAADGQPLQGVVNMATIKRSSFQVDYTVANAADGVEYSYYDSSDWSTKTLRVAVPGQVDALNPATVTGEGITTEAHAAKLARYHLAQSLYQYKDITFGADLEHLSYRRMSVLALQHDLTQWGFGGRLMGATVAAGVVSLHLDEPVPAGSTPYVGLRIPGERVYRVLRVVPFTGTSDVLQLLDPWPSDAAFPGDVDGNPAHDTIWIYDFKATPGYRVRVVAIQPDSDYSGATVAVVPESPEFWTYVNTGAYTPPANVSQLLTRPVVSNLQISESQVVQGDTVFTELQAAFNVAGPVAYCTVHAALKDGDDWGELVAVAETRTNSARWRVPAAGVYRIVVRAFNADGVAGQGASIDYVTLGADIPPPAFDLFEVVEAGAGIRKYVWGYLADTLQAPDFAGAEIRYITGTVTSPNWDDMTPIGQDGFYTAPFESLNPAAGTWTFAARARNTSGDLSPMTVITRTLAPNLVGVIGGITQEQINQQTRLDQEAYDRNQADLAVAAAAAADATAKANAARDAALTQVDALAAEVAEIAGAPEWEAPVTYPAGFLTKRSGALYRAKVETTGDAPETSPLQWEKLGDYASVADMAAAALTKANQTATELEAESTRVDLILARMTGTTGALATQAQVAAVQHASVTEDEALAERINLITAEVADKASVDAMNVLSGEVDDLGNALGLAMTAVRAQQNGAGGNLCTNPTAEIDLLGWVLGGEGAAHAQTSLARNFNAGYTLTPGTFYLFQNGNAGSGTSSYSDARYVDIRTTVEPGKRYCVQILTQAHRCTGIVYWGWANADGTAQVGTWNSIAIPTHSLGTANKIEDYTKLFSFGVAPAGAATLRIFVRKNPTLAGWPDSYLFFSRVGINEVGADATAAPAWSGNNLGTETKLASAQSTLQAGITAEGEARALAITEVRAQQQGSGNLLRNSGFERDLSGWTEGGSTGAWEMVQSDGHWTSGTTKYLPPGTTGVRLRGIGAMAAGIWRQAVSDRLPVDVTKKYMASTWMNVWRSRGSIILAYYTAADIWITETGAFFDAPGGAGVSSPTMAQMTRRFTPQHDVPANAAYMRLILRMGTQPGAASDPVGWFMRPILEELPAGKTEPSNWMDGAAGLSSALFTMTAAQNAQIVLSTNVNDHVTGITSVNDGTRSTFTILSTVFRVFSGSAASAMEWQANYIRIYGSGFQLVMGTGFGASGNLVQWFGANIGAAACTTANCIEAKTITGQTIIRGSNSAGSMEFSNTLITMKNASGGTLMRIGIIP